MRESISRSWCSGFALRSHSRAKQRLTKSLSGALSAGRGRAAARTWNQRQLLRAARTHWRWRCSAEVHRSTRQSTWLLFVGAEVKSLRVAVVVERGKNHRLHCPTWAEMDNLWLRESGIGVVFKKVMRVLLERGGVCDDRVDEAAVRFHCECLDGRRSRKSRGRVGGDILAESVDRIHDAAESSCEILAKAGKIANVSQFFFDVYGHVR